VLDPHNVIVTTPPYTCHTRYIDILVFWGNQGMTRIVYGVSGEGSGHSSRALEMGRHLLAQGHELKVVSYDRGFRNLSPHFDTLEIEGLHIVSENNRVRPLKTAWHNLRRARAALRRLAALRQCLRSFRPEVVITDFEPSTAWLARFNGIPLISLDNQHRMRYMQFSSPKALWFSRCVATLLIRLMIPPPNYALATTYYYGEPTNQRTFLFPPILKREVVACRPTSGPHHLVYVTSHFENLLSVLQGFEHEQFVVYGANRTGVSANLSFKPFSVEGFLRDLESCRSVIATAGFTLISEAIYLGKPYLALPIHGQFEQQLNAICLDQLGYGLNASAIDAQTFAMFMAALPQLDIRVKEYARAHRIEDAEQANREIRDKLDELLVEVADLLRR
jgi:uncharacterized protein (TIGR00661 family)